MARYRGLCVGGPKDGFYLEHTHMLYQCYKAPELPSPLSLDRETILAMEATVEMSFYRYIALARTKFGDEMGVWLHQERVNYRVPSTYDALTRFFEAYHAKANRLRFLATCGIPLPEEEVKNAQTEPPDAPTGSSGEQTRETED